MPVSTSRFASALAAVVVALGGWIASRYFAGDEATTDLIFVITAAIEGLLVPAAAAPVGTVDAVRGRDS